MFFNLRKFATGVLLLMFAIQASAMQNLFAEEHAVSSAQLHETLVGSAKARQANAESIQKFFASKPVTKRLSGHVLKFGKVEKAIPLLSDEELSRLASQVQQVETDIAAGVLTNEQITYIIIALATAVVILVIVAA